MRHGNAEISFELNYTYTPYTNIYVNGLNSISSSFALNFPMMFFQALRYFLTTNLFEWY